MPGSIMGSPDYLRISLTASDRMVERACRRSLRSGSGDRLNCTIAEQ